MGTHFGLWKYKYFFAGQIGLVTLAAPNFRDKKCSLLDCLKTTKDVKIYQKCAEIKKNLLTCPRFLLQTFYNRNLKLEN